MLNPLKLLQRGVSALGRGVAAVTLKPAESAMNSVIKNILISLLKGVAANLLLALAAGLNAFAAVVPPSEQHALFIWGFVVTGVHVAATAVSSWAKQIAEAGAK